MISASTSKNCHTSPFDLLFSGWRRFSVCFSSLFIGKAAAFVGLLLGLAVIWVAFKTCDSRGAPVARYVTAAAYLVLVLVGSYFANAWYLQLRGVEQTVTIAAPDQPPARHPARPVPPSTAQLTC